MRNLLAGMIFSYLIVSASCAAAGAGGWVPVGSPLQDLLNYMELAAEKEAPHSFCGILAESAAASYLARNQVPGGFPGGARNHYLQRLRETNREHLPALRLEGKGYRLSLHPYWEGRWVTTGTSGFRQVTNGWKLIWSRNRHWGGRLEFHDAVIYGDATPLDSPAYTPSTAYVWVDSADGETYHDEVRGGLFYRGKYAQVFLGREHLHLGRSDQLSVFPSAPAAAANQFLWQLTPPSLELSFQLAELHSNLPDSSGLQPAGNGRAHLVERSKFLVLHRLGFRGAAFQLGVAEMVIFSDQGLRLGYLNPFNFYWSEEHAGGDRDNALVALDWTWRRRGVRFYGGLLLDDLSTRLIFTDRAVNKLAGSAGVRLALPGGLLLSLEGGAARPFVFTHFHESDNYTHGGRLLTALAPNSLNSGMRLWWPWRRGSMELSWRYAVRGKGYVDDSGNWVNSGGDLAHPLLDSDRSYPFLGGLREYEFFWEAVWFGRFQPRLPGTRLILDRLGWELRWAQRRVSRPVDADSGRPGRRRHIDNCLTLALSYAYDY